MRRAAVLLGLAALAGAWGWGQRPDEEARIRTIATLEERVAESPLELDTWYRLALLYEDADRIDEAEDAYRRILQVQPRHGAAQGGLGWILYLKGEYQGAVAASRRALQFDPDLLPARYNVGLALVAAGDLEGAVSAYEKAVAADPDRKGIEAALRDLVARIDAEPEAPELHYCAALLYRHANAVLFEMGSLNKFLEQGGGPTELMDAAYQRQAELRAEIARRQEAEEISAEAPTEDRETAP